MPKLLVLGLLLLARSGCHHSEPDGEGGTKQDFRGETDLQFALVMPVPVPAHVVDVDGDATPDLLTPNRWFLARADGWEEIPAGEHTFDDATHVAVLEDRDHDGRVDGIWLDGEAWGN